MEQVITITALGDNYIYLYCYDQNNAFVHSTRKLLLPAVGCFGVDDCYGKPCPGKGGCKMHEPQRRPEHGNAFRINLAGAKKNDFAHRTHICPKTL